MIQYSNITFALLPKKQWLGGDCLRRKSWKVLTCDKEQAAALAQKHELTPLAAYFALSRGIASDEDAAVFFDMNPELRVDPFSLPDMQKAVQRIEQALEQYERIAIFGDYDTDGVTATAILYSYLEAHGADVIYALPDRQADGYGLHAQAVERLREQGVKLIITVDNGISAFEAAEKAQELGVDLVITDHHRAGKTLPKAVAVVDPHREDRECPFRDYSGAGVAFMLVCALEGGDYALALEEYGDLAAIGTVGDIVPLHGENRSLVRLGLSMMQDNLRVGLAQLMEIAGDSSGEITVNKIAYRISPRINAAGRMASAELALSLLLCDEPEAAASYAQEMDDVNTERQKCEAEIFAQAQQQIMAEGGCPRDAVLVVAGEGWHEGVIGIVAAKLVEKFGKPAIVLSVSQGVAKGSGRSYDGFSLFSALQAVQEHLLRFGGHHNAAGMTLDTGNIPVFREALHAYAKGLELPFPVLQIDCRLNPASLQLSLLDALETLEPFGAGNPQPVFGLFAMELCAITELKNGKYLRIAARKAGKADAPVLQLVYFGGGKQSFLFRPGDVVDFAVTLSRDSYQGTERVSVLLQDCRPSKTREEKVLPALRLCEKIAGGAPLTREECAMSYASRDFCAALYKHLRAQEPAPFDAEICCMRMGDDGTNLCKIQVAFDAMLELGVLALDETGCVAVPELSQKVNMEQAPLLQRIQQMT